MIGIGVTKAGLPIRGIDLDDDERRCFPAESAVRLRTIRRNPVRGGMQIDDWRAAALWLTNLICRG